MPLFCVSARGVALTSSFRRATTTPHGFVVEVSRLDKDAGWCYELDLQWMAYGFATGDEQAIGRDPEPFEPPKKPPAPG